MASQVALLVKNPPVDDAGDVRDQGWIPGSGRSPGEGKWQPTSVFLPGESHGQRSLVGPSPYGGPESDTTEQLSTTQIHFTGRDLNLRGRDAFFSLFFFFGGGG